MLKKTATDLVKEARIEIENLSPNQVSEELSRGDTILIDLRESEELKQDGKISGSVNVPRGLLEFSADPSSPKYKPEFKEGKRIILYCGSGSRSALASSTLKQMGYENIAHLEGGYKAWKESGKPIIE